MASETSDAVAKLLACSAAELAEKDGADRDRTIVHKAMLAEGSVVTPDVLEALVKIDDQALTRTDAYVYLPDPSPPPQGSLVFSSRRFELPSFLCLCYPDSRPTSPSGLARRRCTS